MTRVQGKKNTQYTRRQQPKQTKTLADIKKPQLKAARQQAAAPRTVAQQNQKTLSDFLSGAKKQTDLDAFRADMQTFGTSAQRAEFDKLNHTFKKEGQALLDDYLGNVKSKSELESLRTMVETNGSQAQKARFNQWESYFQKPTWQKYADLHGTSYNSLTSGVGEADRRAAAIIAQNEAEATARAARAKVTQFTGDLVPPIKPQQNKPIINVDPPHFGSTPGTTAKTSGFMDSLKNAFGPKTMKALKWAGRIALGLGAVYLAYKGISALINKNNESKIVDAEIIEDEDSIAAQNEQAVQSQARPESKVGAVATPQIPKENQISAEQIVDSIRSGNAVPANKIYVAQKGDSYELMIRNQYLPEHKDVHDAVKQELKAKLGYEPSEDQIVAEVAMKFCHEHGINYFHAQPKPLVGDTVIFDRAA